MAKFVFELQEILDFRNFEQEQAQIELGKALAVENQINQNLAQIAQQYAMLKHDMKGERDFNMVIIGFAQKSSKILPNIFCAAFSTLFLGSLIYFSKDNPT